jgi:hypothetical protein
VSDAEARTLIEVMAEARRRLAAEAKQGGWSETARYASRVAAWAIDEAKDLALEELTRPLPPPDPPPPPISLRPRPGGSRRASGPRP